MEANNFYNYSKNKVEVEEKKDQLQSKIHYLTKNKNIILY